MRHFLHTPRRGMDPAFLHDERVYMEQGRAVLAVLEHKREALAADIERARALAHDARIPIESYAEERAAGLLALIGIGNRFRRDDAAGLEVARLLRQAQPRGVAVMEEHGEPVSLLEAWRGADEALVIDGVRSGAAPGTLHRFELPGEELPATMFTSSSHVLGLPEAVKLGQELERLPQRLVVYGIEGEDFELGEGLSARVQETVTRLVAELHAELEGRA